MPDLLFPFLALITLLTITPGPDMLLVLRNGFRGGTPIAWATGLGCCTGIAIHAGAAVLGLSAIIAASATAFDIVKLAGAAYLIWLGASSIAATLRRGSGAEPLPSARPAVATRSAAPTRELAFRQGLASNLLNPKIAVLFLTLLPQFVTGDEPRIATTLVLAASFLAVALVWMRLLSLAIAPVARLLARERLARWFGRVTGALLVAVGMRVGIEG